MVELWELNISEAIEGIHNRSFSCVEMVKSSLSRTFHVEPKVQSFITITEQAALAAAEQADLKVSSGLSSPLT